MPRNEPWRLVWGARMTLADRGGGGVREAGAKWLVDSIGRLRPAEGAEVMYLLSPPSYIQDKMNIQNIQIINEAITINIRR